jgi:hypothetical protein
MFLTMKCNHMNLVDEGKGEKKATGNGNQRNSPSAPVYFVLFRFYFFLFFYFFIFYFFLLFRFFLVGALQKLSFLISLSRMVFSP